MQKKEKILTISCVVLSLSVRVNDSCHSFFGLPYVAK